MSLERKRVILAFNLARKQEHIQAQRNSVKYQHAAGNSKLQKILLQVATEAKVLPVITYSGAA
jgi:hypothetical protein